MESASPCFRGVEMGFVVVAVVVDLAEGQVEVDWAYLGSFFHLLGPND